MMIHYEDFERERLNTIYDTIAPYSEISGNERYFLNGIIRSTKPKKILEAGVSSGGSSAIILNAIKDIDGAELYSVDYSEKAYRHPDKPSGFLVEEKFPELVGKWHMFRGGDVSRFIEEIGGDIDLLVLDTVHSHPWETLNFLCVLPFMRKNFSWTVLHDISLCAIFLHTTACRYLFGHVVSGEKISPAPNPGYMPANLGAFRVDDDTVKYIGNLFESLLIPWETEVPLEDSSRIKKIIEKYYSPEQYKSLCDAFQFQALRGRKWGKQSLRDSLKLFLKAWQPKVYYGLKHFMKG